MGLRNNMKSKVRQVRELAQKYNKELIEFSQRLVQTHSVNGQQTEDKVVKLIGGRIKNGKLYGRGAIDCKAV